MPLEPLAARFERAGLPRPALREWFTRLLLYGVGLIQVHALRAARPPGSPKN